MKDKLMLADVEITDKNVYIFLSRLKEDAWQYILEGSFSYNKPQNLFSLSVEDHVADMRRLYEACPEEPQWFVRSDYEALCARMEGLSKGDLSCGIEIPGMALTPHTQTPEGEACEEAHRAKVTPPDDGAGYTISHGPKGQRTLTGQGLLEQLQDLGPEKLKEPVYTFHDHERCKIELVDGTIRGQIDINIMDTF